jgi:hypothetical protein
VEEHLPIRCRAEEVAGQLRLVVAGLPFLADRSWDEVGWGRMRIELLSLWRVEMVLEPDRTAIQVQAQGRDGEVVLSRVERADAPDGRCWVYGCQRDDWTLGPDSRLVEPLQFLSSEERIALEELLRDARCWPEPVCAEPLAAVVSLEERIRPKRRRRTSKRRRAEKP